MADKKANFNKNNKNGKNQGNRNFNSQPRKNVTSVSYPLVYFDGMTVGDVASCTKKSLGEVIKALMMMGMMAGQNETLDQDTCELLATELKVEFKIDETKDLSNFDNLIVPDKEEDLVERPCVVTIMGHVDHGKTTLLDTIRNTRVVDKEFGGITQAIGAYQVERNGKKITFIDTPGHAAFTEMRARGAAVTDIVVIVVAADDGVMPQTREAIDHALASKCPIIVAVNKCDRPGANPDRCKQELAELGILPEEWGGTIPFVNISALKGTNVPTLLDTIQLVAEVEEYKANPNNVATGYVLESKLDKTKGPTATLLVKNGTLHTSDILVCGNTWGKIRMMFNDLGRQVRQVEPGDPVSVVGLSDVPQAGDQFLVFSDEKQARHVSEIRSFKAFNQNKEVAKSMSLEDLFAKASEGTVELKIIVKADTFGSSEACKSAFEKIKVEGIDLQVIRSNVGTITETDVLLAQASNAIIIGFNVAPLANVKDFAKSRGVEIRLYNIIYKALEDIEAAMKGMLAPVYEDKVIGQAQVLKTFKISKIGTVAGCMVTDGYVKRNALVTVARDGVIVYNGKLSSLKREKDDVREVKNGFDCGIMIENYNDLKVGDLLEFSITEEVKDEE